MTWPLVYAHRGASADFPEHTRAAFERALEIGVDGIECDVRLTADGRLVCLHDARVDRTSDGHGRVGTMTLENLRRLDWGSWREFEIPDGSAVEAAAAHELVTLDELLALARDSGRTVDIAIEAKHPARRGAAVEHAIVAALDRYGSRRGLVPGRPSPGGMTVRVISFSVMALRRLGRLAPTVERELLTGSARRIARGRIPDGVRTLGPSVQLVRSAPQALDDARSRGLGLHVWTVDDPADDARCRAADVWAVTTNDPGRLLRARRSADGT